MLCTRDGGRGYGLVEGLIGKGRYTFEGEGAGSCLGLVLCVVGRGCGGQMVWSVDNNKIGVGGSHMPEHLAKEEDGEHVQDQRSQHR